MAYQILRHICKKSLNNTTLSVIIDKTITTNLKKHEKKLNKKLKKINK
jgi:argonaute-like protein implicated in RNA metabolism and viral defense